MADYNLQYQDTYIDALLATANELKTAGYIYKGVATPSTNPGTPTERVAYLASEPGTYTNFGGIVIVSGLYSLTYASGTWTGTQMTAGSDIEVVQTTGQSTSDVMSQKAVTDSLVSDVISYDNSLSGLSAENVQGAVDEVAIDVAINENYCKSGIETRFVQGIVSSSNGNIVVASDNITSVFIDGGCIVTAKDGYSIRRVAKYNKTTEAFISGLYASDDYTRMFIYLEDGYKYRFTVYAGGTNISPNDDVLESIKTYSFPYINSVNNPDRFELINIRPTGELLPTVDNRTFIYRIAFEGQLFVGKYYLDGNFANRGIWVADDRNGTNITRKSTAATIGYHWDKYIATRSDVGKYIFICGKHDPSSGYVLDVGYISNGVDNVYDELSNNINDVTVIPKSVNISDYIYNGWITYTALKWTSQSGGSCIVIPIKSAEYLTVTSNSHDSAMYVFLKTCSPVSNKSLDISTGGKLLSIFANTTVDIVIPADAEYIMFLATVDNVDRKPSNVVIHKRVKESFMHDEPAIFDGIVPEQKWIKTHAYLSITNKIFAVNDYTYSKYINVNEGENFTIVADEGNDCEWATLESIPSLIPNYIQSNAVRCGLINSGNKINITINKGETILILNLHGTTRVLGATVHYSSSQWSTGGHPIVGLPIYGQSLAVGGDAPRITNAAKFSLLTFNSELLINSFSDTQETAKFGLLDSYVESLCIDRCIGQGNVGSSIMSFSFGQGSRSIIYLKKGTTLYTQFLDKIQSAFNIVGSNLIIPAFCWIQGEDDRFGTYTDDYKGELLQLRADLDADIKAITGQTQDVHCIVYQTNQLSIGSAEAGHFVPTSYNSGDYGGLMTVPTAQYELIRDNPYFHAATPIYYMKFAVSSNGRVIHINSESQKVMGYYCGLAAERLTEGLADIGLYVQSVTKVDSTHIQLVLHTPCPPIVIDTQQVYEVDGYGFSVITPNNTNILQSVEVQPNHYCEQIINITTSEDCTNAKVRYGCNGVIAGDSSGYQRGSRGNIRDSQGLQYFATVNGKNIPMHNWLYFGEWLIS